MLHETTETSLRALCEEPNIMYQQISSTLQSDRRDHNVALTLYLFSESILTFLQYRARSFRKINVADLSNSFLQFFVVCNIYGCERTRTECSALTA